MTKHFLVLLFAALLAGANARAQNAHPVVLVSSQGKVGYLSPNGGKCQKVSAGALLLPNGQLDIKGSGRAVVFSNGQFHTLSKGKHALEPIFGAASSLRKLNFDTKFGTFVNNAVLLAAAAQGHNAGWANITDPKRSGDGWGVTDPKKGSDGWGVTDPKKGSDGWGVTDPKKGSDGWGVTDPKKGSDGWGGQGSKITGILPFGKVSAATVRFSWSRPANTTSYQLDIWDSSESPVHTATLRDTFADINLGSLSLKPGELYSWKVTVPDQAALIVSNPLQFLVADPAERQEALDRLNKSDLYAKADPTTRALMEALALEDNDWFSDAANTYAAAIRQNPGQNLARMMYAAFWMRYGLRPLADAAVLK